MSHRPRRRPGPRRSPLLRTPSLLVSVAALAALAACGSDVEITSTGLSEEERAACEALVADLPDTLFDQERVETSGDGIGAAWGDPPVVLTCGAGDPEEFDAWARCSEIAGIGWYVPDSQMKDAESDVVMTAQSHSPRVSLAIPAAHRFNGPDTHLKTIGEVLGRHLTETQPCR
ncbi:DUF3515 domain-containing protein [Nocardioides sp. Y6]|uniref:DUF3515 domain-containing protein n=1 Tax=Nocardioides malaquae TaxID=2773426 RepID=A0ABR9RPR1_9ACTN|nr:DUF3515 domain-containing protein [Nocardioides malaquae]MBE7323390.1 DUF3515 domain-containing protein [Nocardioides malaquae]